MPSQPTDDMIPSSLPHPHQTAAGAEGEAQGCVFPVINSIWPATGTDGDMQPPGDGHIGLPENGLPTSSVPEMLCLHPALVLPHASGSSHCVPEQGKGTDSKGAGAGMVLAAKPTSTFKTLTPGSVREGKGPTNPMVGAARGDAYFLSEEMVIYFQCLHYK